AVGWNVLGHHAASADDRVFADGDVGQNGAPRTDRGALPNKRTLDLPVSFGLHLAAVCRRARVQVVDKCHVVANEHIVFDVDAFAYERVTRNLAVLAHSRILLNLHEGADFGFVADLASIQVDEFGKLDVLAELDARSNAQIGIHTIAQLTP